MSQSNEEKLVKYSYNEVYTETLKYFDNDTLATDVWIKKYCLKDSEGNLYEKTPDDMHKRIAKELARIESKYPKGLNENEIYETLKNFNRIVPQGSPMSGIGNNFQIVSLSNCFVIGNDNDSDSYGGIMKIDQSIAQLQKRRAGVGTDLSFIRPKDSPVKNSALTSTGVVPFMERFSNTTKEVAQNNRRGALLESISIKHPDAEDFIDAKLTQGKITGANISVKIDDEFMHAVLNNTAYKQQYPVDSNSPKIVKEIDAKKLWKKLMYNSWKSAEPGILYWNTIIRESIPDCYADLGFKTVSTNPCQPLWAKVLTPNGIREFKDINIGDIIWSSEGWTNIINKWSTGIKKVYRYGTTFNCFYGTENHKVLDNKEKIEVNNAKNIDLLRGISKEKIKYDPRIVMDGLVLGDGTVHKASNDLVLLCIGKDDNDYFDSEISNLIYRKRDGVGEYQYEIRTSITSDELVKTYNRRVPERYLNGNNDIVCSFLRGLYSANGSVVSNRITLKSASFKLIEDVQLMLNSIGITSYYTTNKPTKVKFSNGEYLCKESYDLNISKDRNRFQELIGFLQIYKNEKLDKVIQSKIFPATEILSKKIIKKEFISEEEVFDITVDNNSHTYWTQGCNVSNCGEITLCNYDSCRLLLINLFNYVINPFTKESYFDFDLFRKDVYIAERYMDDIVDLEIEKIEKIIEKINSDPEDEFIKIYELDLWKKIKEKAILGRRTGLGITAEGDMLAALGYRYGTDEATDFSVSIHNELKLVAYRSSVNMAQERGKFSMYDSEREKNNPFINRIKNEDPNLYNDMIKYGRRNMALLTIAPAGSVSICTQTTSGIEPVYNVYYTRRRKINPQEENIKVDYTDGEGVTWAEYPVFHHKFELWLKINKYDIENIKLMSKNEINEIVKLSPYYKATSNDLDWVKKVEMQGKIQREVDHSISVTTNLPSDATEEMVSKVYEMAWTSGCKGMTIYRDGSRDGVLISNDDKELIKKMDLKDNHAPKRPKRLKGEIMRFMNQSEKWIAVIGLLDNRPYELFTGMLTNGLAALPVNIKTCEIIKIKDENGNKRYDIEYIDNNNTKQILTGLSHKFNPAFWNYAKMISGLLRHGMPLVKIFELIDSLNLDDSNLNTWKAGVMRILKKYIKDGEKLKGKCPECGSDNLEFKEGCLTCMQCGNSKCG